jgi:hypothetical protein
MTAAQRLAHERLAARRRRDQQLRRTVLGVAIALFVALFATIYVQMASGNDPALSTSSAKVAAAPSTSSGTGVPGSTSSGPTPSGSTSSSDATPTTTSSPAPVTTGQS